MPSISPNAAFDCHMANVTYFFQRLNASTSTQQGLNLSVSCFSPLARWLACSLFSKPTAHWRQFGDACRPIYSQNQNHGSLVNSPIGPSLCFDERLPFTPFSRLPAFFPDAIFAHCFRTALSDLCSHTWEKGHTYNQNSSQSTPSVHLWSLSGYSDFLSPTPYRCVAPGCPKKRPSRNPVK